MSSTVASNAWAEIIHHASDGILEQRWLPGQMTEGAFMASLALLALEAERLTPSAILIDATQFQYRPGPSVMEWRNNCIIPRYGSAGVRKFALLAPAGFPDTIEEGGKEVIDERPKETGFWCREVGIDFRPSLGAVFRPTNFFNVARCVERITDTHSEASEFVRR